MNKTIPSPRLVATERGLLYLLSRKLFLPQRFCFPTFRKTHRLKVYLREIQKQPTEFGLKIIVRRNDVQKIFNDTNVVVYSVLVGGKSYPRTSHAFHIIRNDFIHLVPNP